jgi:hypothetical protein
VFILFFMIMPLAVFVQNLPIFTQTPIRPLFANFPCRHAIVAGNPYFAAKSAEGSPGRSTLQLATNNTETHQPGAGPPSRTGRTGNPYLFMG